MSQKRSADDSHDDDEVEVPEAGTGIASQWSNERKCIDGGSKRSCSVPSANSSPGGGSGLRVLNDCASVLSHRLCLPLLYYLNQEEIKIDDHQQVEQLPLYRQPIDTREYDTIFSTAWTDCERELHEKQQGKPIKKEAKLTQNIVLKINNTQNSRSFAAESEYPVTGNKNSGCIDILLRKIPDSTSTIHPVLIIEFGKGHQQFYKKLEQLNHYIHMIEFDEHILSAVITIENTSKDNNNNQSSMNINIGLFFCYKRHDTYDPSQYSIRKTLIWKSNSGNGIVACTNHFAKLLKATENYIHWANEPSHMPYRYFSSNCCKIDNQVYRVYDDRCHKLYRTPNVYLHCYDFEFNLNTEDETSDAVIDMSTCKKLGKRLFTMTISSLPVDSHDGTITKKTVTVISTPYRVGNHWTTHPTSFIPIIYQLKKLHSNDYVHGDIRAYNIIFNNYDGWLIDFDFSGKCVGQSSPVTYPPGYVSALKDGLRIGTSGKRIWKWHDWYALGNLIFKMHTIQRPQTLINRMEASDRLTILEKKAAFLEKKDDLYIKWTKWITPDLDDTLVTYNIEELVCFLNECETYGFTLVPRIIEESNEIVQEDLVMEDAKKATSSPQYKENEMKKKKK